MTRIFFVADLHGSAVCFRKFVNAARVYRADILLVGGDVAAKTMTPVFSEGTEWTVTGDGETRTARNPEELARLEASLRDSATLPLRTTRAEWEDLLADRDRADRAFEALALDDLRRWLAWARERLADLPTRLLIGLGNDDLTSMESVIANDDRAELTDQEILAIDGHHEMLTIPYSNPTPWKTHRELSEEQIARRIDDLAGRLREPARAVFNIHVPPFGTPLDLAPKLLPDLTKAMSPGGETEMVHVGSTAVRAALERYHPLLALHGHIHESRGTTTFGRTLSVNCGSAYNEGALLGALVDLDPDKVRSAVLTSG
ncbi:MAG: metallophosphoesterase [Candidatus Thermoplasmatota archaeon]|jgi:Icc-related predicted phosphoesterase|nr:metallophosphoesterase [Candidatus Thermoplasmatota archaeon]MCL5983471.1 metallophosphoesterase [Candidatus Thermoplasmatota archaeon]